MASAFNSSKHPRGAAGSGKGGKFIDSNTPGNDPAAGGAENILGEVDPQTIRAYQAAHGLKVDGIIGHQTAEALLGHQNASRVKTGGMTNAQYKALAKIGGANVGTSRRSSGRSRKHP